MFWLAIRLLRKPFVRERKLERSERAQVGRCEPSPSWVPSRAFKVSVPPPPPPPKFGLENFNLATARTGARPLEQRRTSGVRLLSACPESLVPSRCSTKLCSLAPIGANYAYKGEGGASESVAQRVS